MKTKTAVSFLGALAQETRLDIFRLLVVAGPDGLTPGLISEQLGIPAATLSFHLKELTRAKLLNPRRESRHIFYSANYATMNQLLAFMTENCCDGRACEITPRETLRSSSAPKRRKAAS